MAGIQASGVGSGLDINGLVTQLVSAENASRSAPILRRESRGDHQDFRARHAQGRARRFQGRARRRCAISTSSRCARRRPEDATRFTATASSKAAAGSYDVEVINLASAHRLASDPYVGGAHDRDRLRLARDHRRR